MCTAYRESVWGEGPGVPLVMQHQYVLLCCVHMENHLVGDADCAFALPWNTQLLGCALPFEAQKLEIISDTVKLSRTI